MMLKFYAIDYLDKDGKKVGQFPELINNDEERANQVAALYMKEYSKACNWKVTRVYRKV